LNERPPGPTEFGEPAAPEDGASATDPEARTSPAPPPGTPTCSAEAPPSPRGGHPVNRAASSGQLGDEDIRVRGASRLAFALELETLGRCAWRTSLACHLLLRLDARVRVTVGGAEPEARPGRYRARAHDREPAG